MSAVTKTTNSKVHTNIRIAGVDLPAKKKLKIGLSYLYGIGRKNVFVLCQELGLNPEEYLYNLSDADVKRIIAHLSSSYTIEGDLRTIVNSNIDMLVSIGSYKGMRHRKSLPVRGQRTKTNAKTRKSRQRRK